jgi:multiple sugar transport system substrate-binding protein
MEPVETGSAAVTDAEGQGGGGSFARSFSRREIIKLGGLACLAAGAGPAFLAACGSAATSSASGAPKGPRSLSILQWSHFVPQYDTWFDPFVQSWGSKNNVHVKVDHIDNALIPARTAAEVNAGSGHDLIEWIVPASQYEPNVVDVTDVVKEVEAKYGNQIGFCKLSSYNPVTNKYFGLCHGWAPDPGDYLKSRWSAVGQPNGPTSYDELMSFGTEIYQKTGVRVGLGMSNEVDSNMAARAMIWSYGGSIQDAQGNVVFNSPETVAAVEYMVKLWKQAETSEVFSWTAASNNQGLVAGQLNYILNSISAYRTAQQTNPSTADDIFFVPALKGPSKMLASEHVIYSYIIPKFSKNVDAAKQFLVDYIGNYHDSVYQSQLYNFPAFQNTGAQKPLFGSGGWLDNDPFGSHPANKLSLLKNAQQWSTNVGYPGPANAAIGEVFTNGILPNMMASAAKGSETPAQAVASAESQIKTIFEKWRAKGLVGGSR